MSIINQIKFEPINPSQYYREAMSKFQIYIHHTAGATDPRNAIRWWEATGERVATAFVIGGWDDDNNSSYNDGDLIQIYNSGYWAHHLGLKSKHLKAGFPNAKTNVWLNKHSIGIELANWGGLTKTDDGKFLTYTKKVIPENQVIDLGYDYRGYRYYQKYTTAQLTKTHDLVQYLCSKYDLPTVYKGSEMFNVCPNAIRGEPGIWTHTSVRPDKSDCSPQPALIEMLKAV